MNQRERVVRAIQFDNPDRVPIWLFNQDQEQGDILWYDFRITEGEERVGYHGGTKSEWGYAWRTMDDGTMGQPTEPVIPTWEDLAHYEFPTLNPDRRLAALAEFRTRSEGYYRLVCTIITGFTTYTFLRGFENAMMDFASASTAAETLLDGIFSFEKELMTLAAETGMDGYHFGDDWGTQRGMVIAPALWRKLFKPRYEDQFAHARDLGLHVWFHSCGNVSDILEDLHEIGVDVMNIAQPNVLDIASVGRRLKGKQCFLIPISYQTVSISGTADEITQEAHRLYECLGTQSGGFIGYVEEYGCMGMSDENYRACIQAFRSLH
jgi:uroporphyrinogen-III decarboxylase